jgi:hypothetical protein
VGGADVEGVAEVEAFIVVEDKVDVEKGLLWHQHYN